MREKTLSKISDIYHKHHGVDGYRSMQVYLEREGFSYSTTTVHKYMNSILGLKSIVRPKKPDYEHGKPHKVFENKIQQNFSADEINQKWCTDFTYLFLENHDVRYNCTIIDLHDRSVIASITDRHITSDLAIRTLQKALESQPAIKGELILHSDYAEEKTMPKNLITSCILIIRIQFFGIVFRVSQARRLLSLYQRSSIAFRHRQLWEQTC